MDGIKKQQYKTENINAKLLFWQFCMPIYVDASVQFSELYCTGFGHWLFWIQDWMKAQRWSADVRITVQAMASIQNWDLTHSGFTMPGHMLAFRECAPSLRQLI